MDEHQARAGRDGDGTAEAFPGLAGADARDHLVPADERADGVGAHVAELRDEDEVEQEEFALHAGKEIDLLDEVQQPRHIHEAEQRGGDGGQAGLVVFGHELAHAQAEHEQDEEAGLKVVHARGAAGGADDAVEVQEGADHQQQAADDAGDLEVDHPALFRDAVEFNQPREGEEGDQQQEHAVGDVEVPRKHRPEDDGPEDDGG